MSRGRTKRPPESDEAKARKKAVRQLSSGSSDEPEVGRHKSDHSQVDQGLVVTIM